MQRLVDYIHSIRPVSDAFADALRTCLKSEKLPRKHWLLQPGQVSNRLYFIEQGLARGFYLKDDKEVTTWFMKEGNFIVSIVSFYSRTPSLEYIELLEDSVLYSLTQEQLAHLYQTFPEFDYIGRVLTERYYIQSEQRSYTLRIQSAQERYQHLLTEFPDIFRRVTLKLIASYLCLSPEKISRLRAEKR